MGLNFFDGTNLVVGSPKQELTELKSAFLSRNAILKRTYEQGERFLAHPIRHIKLMYYHLTNKEEAWKTE